jgi:hypothetical protein
LQCELTNENIEWKDIKLPMVGHPTTKSLHELLDLICPDCSDYLTKYYDEWNIKIHYRYENCDFMVSEGNNTLVIMEGFVKDESTF